MQENNCVGIPILDLDQIGDVHGHLVDASVVEFFDVVQRSLIVVSDEVDGHSLAAETTTTADSEEGRKDKEKVQ